MAAEKLQRVEQWYRQAGSGPAAARRIQAIVAAIGCLEYFPNLGRVQPGEGGLRELACQEHRVVYEVLANDTGSQVTGDVLILDVFGPGEA